MLRNPRPPLVCITDVAIDFTIFIFSPSKDTGMNGKFIRVFRRIVTASSDEGSGSPSGSSVGHAVKRGVPRGARRTGNVRGFSPLMKLI
jgi:hypothetical protein